MDWPASNALPFYMCITWHNYLPNMVVNVQRDYQPLFTLVQYHCKEFADEDAFSAYTKHIYYNIVLVCCKDILKPCLAKRVHSHVPSRPLTQNEGDNISLCMTTCT